MLHLMTQIAMTNRKFAWGVGKKLHFLFVTARQETHTQAHPLPTLCRAIWHRRSNYPRPCRPDYERHSTVETTPDENRGLLMRK